MASTKEPKGESPKKELKPKPARQSDGKFAKPKIEIESGLQKKIDYSVKKKIDAPTGADESAGKYSKQEKLTPSFGTVKTILH